MIFNAFITHKLVINCDKIDILFSYDMRKIISKRMKMTFSDNSTKTLVKRLIQ